MRKECPGRRPSAPRFSLRHLGILLLGLPISCLAADKPAEAGLQASIVRGSYLATAADCAACHRTPGANTPSFAGGLEMELPFGRIVASNITPSVSAGIGNYSEQDFVRALTLGRRRNGSWLYPAMPYPAYAGLQPADLHDLYNYFMHGVAPDDQTPAKGWMAFPYSVRRGLALWNALFARQQEPPPTTGESATLRRGRYLVDVLGHCGSCHTPHNIAMAEEHSHYLQGGHVDGWMAPDITSDPVRGLGDWSQDEIVSYLRDGHATGKAMAAGGMAEAVENSLHALTHADLGAIATYLQHVPGRGQAGHEPPAWAYAGDPEADRRPALAEGREIYARACASCHRLSGEGAYGDWFPALSHNSTVGAPAATNLIQVILHGIDRASGPVRVHMPGFAGSLDNRQIAALTTYVRARFGRETGPVTTDEVATARRGGLPVGLRAMLITGPWLGLLVLLGLIWTTVRRWQRRHAANRSSS